MLFKNACVGVSVAKSIFKLGGVATILSHAALMHPSRYTLKGICCRFYQTGSKKTLQPAQKMIDELRQALNSGNAVDGLDIMERTSFLMNVNDTSIELVRAVLRKTIDVPPHQRSGNVSRLLSLGRHIPRGQLFSKFHADLVKHLAETGTEEEFLELAVRLTPLISSENAELLFRMMCCRYIEVLPTDIIKTLIVESIGSVTVRRRLGISAAQISKLVESALAAAIWLNDTELIGNVLSTALSSRVRLHPVGFLEALNRLPEEWLSTLRRFRVPGFGALNQAVNLANSAATCPSTCYTGYSFLIPILGLL
ncbi:hypothetical protein BC829DRAFT_477385 [Chytridium lagenaria]|nr:hypothetical protein BC829DRAFT_477385 [Chytridium lagenaria]